MDGTMLHHLENPCIALVVVGNGCRIVGVQVAGIFIRKIGLCFCFFGTMAPLQVVPPGIYIFTGGVAYKGGVEVLCSKVAVIVHTHKIECTGFSQWNLNGTIAFTAPTLAADGSALSGNMDYTIRANNDSISGGSVAAGANASKTITVKADGKYSTGTTMP